MAELDRLYRSVVLGVAGNETVKRLVQGRGEALARRFVAGENLDAALKTLDDLEREGIHATLDLLGEMVQTPEAADAFTRELFPVLDALRGRDAYLSVKLSQLGQGLKAETAGEDLGVVNARRLLNAAGGVFVRFDMEDSARVDATLGAYRTLRAEGFERLGLVLQSGLYRAEDDLNALLSLKPDVRVVKGAYLEGRLIAWPDRAGVELAFRRLVYRNVMAGNNTAIGTHDERIINDLKLFAERSGAPRERFSFEFLYGIRRDLQRRLAGEGFTVRAYVPFGTQWYAYYSRRIAERPANLAFVLRGLIRG